MLYLFDEETEDGKLCISYPMVEALKHLKGDVEFKDVIVPGRDNIGYKEVVACNGDVCYQSFANLSESHWDTMIDEHCKKLGFIIDDVFELPNKFVPQNTIFAKQEEKYLCDDNIAVLSAFPIFLVDYYGYPYFEDRKSNDTEDSEDESIESN